MADAFSFEVQQKIAKELSTDEVLLWCGQPKGGFRWFVNDVYLGPFFLVWLLMALFMAYMAFSAASVMIIIFIPFILIGILFNSRKFIDKWARENTYYGLTSRNVITITEFRGRTVNKFPLADLGSVRITPFDKSRSTISFSNYLGRSIRSWYRLDVNSPFLVGESNAHRCFDSIEDAERVYSLMEQAWRKLLLVDSRTSFPDLNAVLSNEKKNVLPAKIVGLCFSLFVAWQFLSTAGPEMVRLFAAFTKPSVGKTSTPPDTCADWVEGRKAQERVARARRSHPEFQDLSDSEAHQKGLDLDRHGDQAGAIWAWECEVGKNPGSRDGWNDIAYGYQALNNPELALEYARKSTAIDDSFGHGHYTAGRALLVMGRFSEAENELRLAIKNGWQESESQKLLALTLRGLGREEEAKNALKRSLEVRPNDEEAKRYLAGEQFTPTWQSCRDRVIPARVTPSSNSSSP